MPKPYQTAFAWVSREEIEAAQKKGGECCPTCKPYKTPGFIFNANQWIRCPGCAKRPQG
jgi:hypothetical protein